MNEPVDVTQTKDMVHIEKNSVNIGRAIKEVRRARQMTQADLSASTGLTLQAVQNIEAGRRGYTQGSLSAIAKGLDVPVTYLFLLSDESQDKLIQRFKAVARKSLGMPSCEEMAV